MQIKRDHQLPVNIQPYRNDIKQNPGSSEERKIWRWWTVINYHTSLKGENPVQKCFFYWSILTLFIYLKTLKQFQGIDELFREFESLSFGVFQGRTSGPLLFLYYVNGMFTTVDSDCKLILYVDDSLSLLTPTQMLFLKTLCNVLESILR